MSTYAASNLDLARRFGASSSAVRIAAMAAALAVALGLQTANTVTASTWVVTLLCLAVAWLAGENLRIRQARLAAVEPHRGADQVLVRPLYDGVACQEQLMRCAIVVSGCSAGEADRLRRAMSRKRSREDMMKATQSIRDGMHARGVDEEAEVHLPMDWRVFAFMAISCTPQSSLYRLQITMEGCVSIRASMRSNSSRWAERLLSDDRCGLGTSTHSNRPSSSARPARRRWPQSDTAWFTEVTSLLPY